MRVMFLWSSYFNVTGKEIGVGCRQSCGAAQLVEIALLGSDQRILQPVQYWRLKLVAYLITFEKKAEQFEGRVMLQRHCAC